MKNLLLIMMACLSVGLLCSASKYTGPKYEIKRSEALEAFGHRMEQKYYLQLLNVAGGLLLDTHKECWALNLVDERQLTLEQARPMVVSLINDFWQEINQNPVYQYSLDASQSNKGLKINPDIMGFKIAFWDEQVNRPLSPYLAQIKLVEGKIYYFYADPKTQALQQPPITETIEEARKLVAEKSITTK